MPVAACLSVGVPKIETVLEQVEDLIRSVQPVEAQERLANLLRAMGPAELQVYKPELEATIALFFKKRRRELAQLMQECLAGPGEQALGDTLAARRAQRQPDQQVTASSRRDTTVELVEVLQYLSDHRIFEWSTSYREQLGSLFQRLVDGDVSPAEAVEVHSIVERALATHASEIYSKGYAHSREAIEHAAAIARTVAGLNRFLDLLLEFYAARLQSVRGRDAAQRLRGVTSSMLYGVLTGYGKAWLGDTDPMSVLGQRPDRWAHALPFLNGEHIDRLAPKIPDKRLRSAVQGGVQLLCDSLDTLLTDAQGYFPLPALTQFVAGTQHIDVSLQAATMAPERTPVVARLFLYPERINPEAVERAIESRISVVLAPASPPIRALIDRDERYSRIFVPVLPEGADDRYTEQRLLSTLRNSIYRGATLNVGSTPLPWNFARDFPLSRSHMDPQYRVVRTSVRDLLKTFERRNGVRLWCSLRRSGKTTAGLDLDGFGTGSVLINQTCDSTGMQPGDSLLYERVAAALDARKQLDNDFLMATLREASAHAALDSQRAILVLDEYETLFGQLRTATSSDERLRYTIAQPLLNQFVAFSRENLLVFLGQQPNAHYILMDQNQLSPYVEQDAFPLFSHGVNANASEFMDLIAKVLTARSTFDRSFADAIYRETAGHPWLTVNLLVEFVEWLIERKRPASNLAFTDGDFSSFRRRFLQRDRIQTSPEYSFFRDGAIPQALSAEGKVRNPWLYAMYTVLRHIGREHTSMSCSLEEFDAIVHREDLGFESEKLLQTGERSNFLARTPTSVKPRVPLLARIAAVSSRAVYA